MERFSGPLGLWPWPLINFVLTLTTRTKGLGATRSTGLNVSAENVEKWELIREPNTGRLKGLIVHRELKEG